MLYKEDFNTLKLLAENIQIYAELNKKDIVIENINEMRKQLDLIEKEFSETNKDENENNKIQQYRILEYLKSLKFKFIVIMIVIVFFSILKSNWFIHLFDSSY